MDNDYWIDKLYILFVMVISMLAGAWAQSYGT